MYGQRSGQFNATSLMKKADSQHLSSNIGAIILIPGSVISKTPRKIASSPIDDLARVHPKGNGRPEESVTTHVRVTPQEILADLRAGLPRRFLIGKYRFPQKRVTGENSESSPREPFFTRIEKKKKKKNQRSFFKRLSNIPSLLKNSKNCLPEVGALPCTRKPILLSSRYVSPERNADTAVALAGMVNYVLYRLE